MRVSLGQRVFSVATPATTLLAFILLSVALRLFSFLPSVINHDESTYIVIADGILAGRTYPVDYIDTKPPGIFFIYAGLMSLVGPAIPMLRLAAALVVGLTAALLQRTKMLAGGTATEGFAAGIIYVVMTSMWAEWGVAPNTEIFFNLFTITAVWAALGAGPSKIRLLLAGLALGLGLQIKQVVALEGLALVAFLIWHYSREGRTLRSTLESLIMLAVGVATPFLLTLIYYWRIGHLPDYLFLFFSVPALYPSSRDLLHYFKFSADFFVRFLPVTVFFFVALRHRSVGRVTRELGLLWSTAALAAVLVPGRYFEHYFVQLMLSVSFVAGSFFAVPIAALPGWLAWIRRPVIGHALLALVLVTAAGYPAIEYRDDEDTPRIIAAQIRQSLNEDEQIYAGAHHIVYHLVQRLPPTRCVHPSLLQEPPHARAMGIEVEDELNRIARARPRYLIVHPARAMDGLIDYAHSFYSLRHRFDDGVVIFERAFQPDRSWRPND